MPVTITRSESLIDFLLSKIGDDYEKVGNIVYSALIAEASGKPYCIEAIKPEGRMVKFFPGSNDRGYLFLVAELNSSANSGIINLTAYKEVPEPIQELINQYMSIYPDYNLEIKLSPQS